MKVPKFLHIKKKNTAPEILPNCFKNTNDFKSKKRWVSFKLKNIRNPNTISNSSKNETPENSEILSMFFVEIKHQRLQDSYKFSQKTWMFSNSSKKGHTREFWDDFKVFQKQVTSGPIPKIPPNSFKNKILQPPKIIPIFF